MKELERLDLSQQIKMQLKIIFSESKIIELEYIQNNIYITLMNSKIIILKGFSLQIFNELQIIKEKMYVKSYKKKIINKKALVSEWTNEEIKFLEDNFFVESLDNLSNSINKSFYQISLKATELELIKKREWTTEEVKFLKSNLNESNYELAKLLKRSINSIKAKKRVIKIKGIPISENC